MKIAYDTSGNRILKVESADVGGARGFSVQTLDALPRTHRDGIGPWTPGELRDFIAKCGSRRQRELFGVNGGRHALYTVILWTPFDQSFIAHVAASGRQSAELLAAEKLGAECGCDDYTLVAIFDDHIIESEV